MSFQDFNAITQSYFRGTTNFITFLVTNPDGTNVDISNYYALFHAKHDFTSSVPDLVKDNTLLGGIIYSDPTMGLLNIEIEPTDTSTLDPSINKLYYNLYLTGSLTSGSSEQQISSVLNGTIYLTQGV